MTHPANRLAKKLGFRTEAEVNTTMKHKRIIWNERSDIPGNVLKDTQKKPMTYSSAS